MSVLRIVPNLPARDPAALAEFYRGLFGLDETFEMGWIRFLGAGAGEAGHGGQQAIALQVASEGGSGTELPRISIEVEDLDAVLGRAREMGAEIVYGPATEPWGLRRFYLRDPEGSLVNVLSSE